MHRHGDGRCVGICEDECSNCGTLHKAIRELVDAAGYEALHRAAIERTLTVTVNR